MKELQRKALNGNSNEPHDFGGLDIDGNMLLFRLRPIFNLSRQQKSRSILPFFSSQLIDIPMCLARPIKSLNLLGGSRSLSQFATDHLNVGDPVVYIGSLNAGTRPIRGSLGRSERHLHHHHMSCPCSSFSQNRRNRELVRRNGRPSETPTGNRGIVGCLFRSRFLLWPKRADFRRFGLKAEFPRFSRIDAGASANGETVAGGRCAGVLLLVRVT